MPGVRLKRAGMCAPWAEYMEGSRGKKAKGEGLKASARLDTELPVITITIMSFRQLRVALCIAYAIYPGYSRSTAAVPPRRAYEDAAMRREGSVSRGREIFGDEQKAACVKCHTVDGSSGRAGPDLFAIGDKFPRRELIHSILEPSTAIAVGYATTTIETKSGEQHDGVVKQATDSWIELMSADGKPQRVTTADIAAQRTSAISLMP